MNIVEAFTSHHHWRICYQLISNPIGRTFTCYIGVLEYEDSHAKYSPLICEGEGLQIPDARKEKVPYDEAVVRVGWRIHELETEGYRWYS